MRVGTGSARGTCGELAQGETSDGVAFTVSLPIDLRATVTVRALPSADVRVRGADALPKLARAATATLELLGVGPHELAVTHASAVPVGRGMGSSTADIVAAARATAAAFARTLSPAELAAIAGGIEPTDGVLTDRIAVADRRGAVLREWRWAPVFDVVVVVPAATQDTPHALPPVSRAARRGYDALLDDLDAAVARRDAGVFAAAGARSAALHREWIGNAWGERLAPLTVEFGAAGWNIAHTGTVAALLFTPGDRRKVARAADGLAQHFGVPTLVTRAG